MGQSQHKMSMANKRRYIYQQIINITPDSFSDGGEINSPLFLLNRIETAFNSGIRFFDFGAQSTAPSSKKIQYVDEIDRFDEFFIPLLKNPKMIALIKESFISIDSYRSETIKYLLNKFTKFQVFPKKLFWNDVSGIVDQETIHFLSLNKDYKLILCHNLVNDRASSPEHYKMTLPLEGKAFLDEVINYFSLRLEAIPHHLRSQVVIDPAFGFSKNNAQNMFLFKNLSHFTSAFTGDQEFLIGISRKKFLRHFSGISMDELSALDDYQDDLFDQYLPLLCDATGYLRCHRCSLGKNYLA